MSRAEFPRECHFSDERELLASHSPIASEANETRPWNVRIREKGDRWGLEDCLVHEDEEPVIEFYDARQDPAKFGDRGQFVSSYYLTTLLQVRGGLCLDGGVPSWTLDAEQMQTVIHDFLIPYTIARFLPCMSEPAPDRVSDEILGA